jgi:hypothetical protein
MHTMTVVVNPSNDQEVEGAKMHWDLVGARGELSQEEQDVSANGGGEKVPHYETPHLECKIWPFHLSHL